MAEPEKIFLREELFIGKGGHQATYVHPENPAMCIKIPHDPQDGDVKKELRYRRMCAKSLENSILITKYYGTVETSKGLGYVFERVLNPDGKTSADLKDFLPTGNVPEEQCERIRGILLRFKEDYLREKIVMADTDITNFMVQQTAPEEYRIRIVDNIGTPVLIPLVYYFDFCAVYRARRYWNFLAGYLHEHYPEIVTTAFEQQLRAE